MKIADLVPNNDLNKSSTLFSVEEYEPYSIRNIKERKNSYLRTPTYWFPPSALSTDVIIDSKVVPNSISKDKFDNINFPLHWEEEGISKPNLNAKNKAYEICIFLYENFDGLLPEIIAPSKEEGIYISFKNPNETNNRSLMIEIYNDLEVAALVNDNALKKILYSEDIEDNNFKNVFNVLTE